VLLISTPVPELRELADSLGAEWLGFPRMDEATPEALEPIRVATRAEAGFRHVVVALWAEQVEEGPLVELDDEGWSLRAERPLLAWCVGMGIASRCVADGGAIVALVESPAPIDSEGLTPEASVAEGAIVLARSLAQSEGPRGVRVNAVTTCARLGGGALAPPPALADRYPGAVGDEVAGAIRLLLSDDAAGMTAGVTHVDCGRTLR
jgi:NAD(P)-dependent dehydrogenase (short-subunit alcohol dehydrogenase family)